jgi:hypothetical protein
MIFDYKNLAMLILSEKDGEKSGMAMPIDSSQAQTELMLKPNKQNG